MQHSYVNMSKVMGNSPAFMRVSQVLRELKMQNQEKKEVGYQFLFFELCGQMQTFKSSETVTSIHLVCRCQVKQQPTPAGCVLVSQRQRILSDLRSGSSIAVCVCVSACLFYCCLTLVSESPLSVAERPKLMLYVYCYSHLMMTMVMIIIIIIIHSIP